LAAGLVCCGFEPERRDELDDLLRDGLAGVILFQRNAPAGSTAEVATLAEDLRRVAGRQIIVCVDQEGGRVQRFDGTGFSKLPAMRDVVDAGDAGARLGRELAAAGVTLNLAPVADVDTNPDNPVIADRSFGRDPADVAAKVAAFVKAHQAAGVACCVKHFPGHGDTAADTHTAAVRLPHDLARLRAVEFPPFAAAIGAGVAAVMTAHVSFDRLDPGIPATLSQAAMRVLRDELGFAGCVISDDLEMAAIAEQMPIGDAAVKAVTAGADLLLVCHRPDRQREAIDALAEHVPTERLREANERVATLSRQGG
jgi:beta-N-acetylhexosaminidase